MPCNHVQESRKPGPRTASARTIDVRSPLARKMVRLVVQFDLAYDQLKAQWHEPGGIDEQEGLELMANARCYRPPIWSHFGIALMEPPRDRANGARSGSA